MNMICHTFWLTADEDAHQSTTLGRVVKQLIKEANKPQVHSQLVQLQSVKAAELHEQYQLIPNIKNPVT